MSATDWWSALGEFESKKVSAWDALHKKYECGCEWGDLAVRKRTVRGGGVQYVMQCTRCGRAASNAMSYAKAISANGGAEPDEFESSLVERREAERSADVERIKRDFDRDAFKASFFADYDKYLNSDEWKAKRALVLQRANNRCEGCGINAASQVHHLTYANRGAEFLFELAALCKPCHDRLHEATE